MPKTKYNNFQQSRNYRKSNKNKQNLKGGNVDIKVDNVMDGFFSRVFSKLQTMKPTTVGEGEQILSPGKIITGGQTGFDEAAAKAAVKYGLEVEVIAPRKWVYRTSEGKDIKDRQSFIERFVPKAPIKEERTGLLTLLKDDDEVLIGRGTETKVLTYKEAQPLLSEDWVIVASGKDMPSEIEEESIYSPKAT